MAVTCGTVSGDASIKLAAIFSSIVLTNTDVTLLNLLLVYVFFMFVAFPLPGGGIFVISGGSGAENL